MAKTSVVNARLNPELKRSVEFIFSLLGLTPSDAVNLFYRQVELNNGLPFELKVPRVPNAETIEAIEEGRRIAKDPNVKGYTDMNELWKALARRTIS